MIALNSPVDRENAFMVFAAFTGDITRTAAALNMPPSQVLKMAEDCGWLERLAPIIALKKSTKPGDVERAVNRALAFVQAHQMRLFVSRVIRSLTGMTDEQFQEYVYPETKAKDGTVTSKLSTRALADLASAMEKCNSVAFHALSDGAQDRVKRKENVDDTEVSTADLHARMAAAMADVQQDTSPRAMLFDQQLSAAQASAVTLAKPVSPNDDDEH